MLLCWVYETTLVRRGRLWWAVCVKMAKSQQSWISVYLLLYIFFVVWSFSHVRLFALLWTAPCQASLHFTVSRSLLKLTSSESVMPSNHLNPCCPLLLPSVFPSIRVFSSESVLLIRWPKDWSCCFSTSPSSDYSKLISFRIDWFDLLTVHGTLKSFLQHCSLKALSLWCSASFVVQLSCLYIITGKSIPLTVWTFVSKVLFLVFNMLSRLVIAFLLRSKQHFKAAVTICSNFGTRKWSLSRFPLHTHTHTQTHTLTWNIVYYIYYMWTWNKVVFKVLLNFPGQIFLFQNIPFHNTEMRHKSQEQYISFIHLVIFEY